MTTNIIVTVKGESYVPVLHVSKAQHCTECDAQGSLICKLVNCQMFDTLVNWRQISPLEHIERQIRQYTKPLEKA